MYRIAEMFTSLTIGTQKSSMVYSIFTYGISTNSDAVVFGNGQLSALPPRDTQDHGCQEGSSEGFTLAYFWHTCYNFILRPSFPVLSGKSSS